MTPVGSRFGTPGAVTPPSAEAPLLRLELKGRLGALFLFFGGEMGVSGTQPPERGEAWRVKLWFSMLGLGESLACFFFFFAGFDAEWPVMFIQHFSTPWEEGIYAGGLVIIGENFKASAGELGQRCKPNEFQTILSY